LKFGKFLPSQQSAKDAQRQLEELARRSTDERVRKAAEELERRRLEERLKPK
jgi:hypothetical protein